MDHVSISGGTVVRSIQQILVLTCLSTSLAGVPISTALAETGFMGVQYEFALGKNPKLRQINLTFQQDTGRLRTFDLDGSRQSGIAVPLYSANPRIPGLLNGLNGSETKDDRKSGSSAGAVIGVLLGVGIAGFLLYATAKCAEEITSVDFNESEQDQWACDALSGLGRAS